MKSQIVPLEDCYRANAAALHEQTFGCIGVKAEDFEVATIHPNRSLVAISDDKRVLGYATYTCSAKGGYLGWYAVAEDFRNHGIGRALFDATAADLRSVGAKSVRLDTRNRFREALRFYLGLGFDIIGSWQQLDGELMISMRLVFQENDSSQK